MKKIILSFLIIIGFVVSANAQVEIKARIGHRHHYYHHYQPVYHHRYHRRHGVGVVIHAHTSNINPTYLQRSQVMLYTNKKRLVA
jgi:hypothetical protein